MAHLFDIIDGADYQAAVDARLINVREDGAGLRILNYSDSAMYTPGAWDSLAVRTCRGLIVDDDWNIVARPWAKFFNHGQAEAGVVDLTAPVEVTDKMDGSLGIIYPTPTGELRVATRGSFISEQAQHATAWLAERDWTLFTDGYTLLVEIVYPGNRIVCDYGDRDELVLLGAVHIESGGYIGPHAAAGISRWPGALTETFSYLTLRDALAAEPRPGMEGMCVRWFDRDHIVKIKQEEYVRLHKIVTGLSERSVWEHMSNEWTLSELLAPLPDELHQWAQDVWNNLADDLNKVHSNATLAHNEIRRGLPDGWTRKEYAEQAIKHGPLRPYLFNLLDGKNPRPGILRSLKPAGDTHARPHSEAVA